MGAAETTATEADDGSAEAAVPEAAAETGEASATVSARDSGAGGNGDDGSWCTGVAVFAANSGWPAAGGLARGELGVLSTGSSCDSTAVSGGSATATADNDERAGPDNGALAGGELSAAVTFGSTATDCEPAPAGAGSAGRPAGSAVRLPTWKCRFRLSVIKGRWASADDGATVASPAEGDEPTEDFGTWAFTATSGWTEASGTVAAEFVEITIDAGVSVTRGTSATAG